MPNCGPWSKPTPMATVSRTCSRPLRGADGFAMLDLAEAERVRQLGWRGPILLLEGVFEPRDLELCSRLSIWHAVHCDAQIDWLAAHKTQNGHRVFLKMNSGMNRLGFTPERYRAAWARLNALPQVEEISFMTHFSDADAGAGQPGISAQLQRFHDATRDLPGERSVATAQPRCARATTRWCAATGCGRASCSTAAPRLSAAHGGPLGPAAHADA